MPFARLVIIQPGQASRELAIETELVTIGRALDNDISLANDSNISRYHAEIELRGGSFLLTDLNSRNGSTVNDNIVEAESRLEDGDLICLGGSTTIEFHVSDFPSEVEEEMPAPQVVQHAAPDISAPASNLVTNIVTPNVAQQTPAAVITSPVGLSPIYIGTAIVGGLVVTAIAGAILFFGSSRGCKASVRIVSPQTGTTVKGPVAIRVEATGTECVDRLIYLLDGVKVASSDIQPYGATLDPIKVSGLATGTHILTVVVEDDKGDRTTQPDEVILGFETERKPSDEVAETSASPADAGTTPNEVSAQGISTIAIKEMCERLLRQLAKGPEHDLNLDLLHEIQTRTSDYTNAGFYQRARPFRDVINEEFVNEQGLDKPLGYVLAMSRSNFDLSTTRSLSHADGEGLWKVPPSIARDAGYLGRCGAETLSDQNQKCAAKVSAAYFRALEIDNFGGDPLYAIACFGMTPKDAAQWREQLPTDRRDLGNVIKTPEQRERVVRFFAAGIVGENPGQFGLRNDSPLSKLYPK